MNYLHSVLKKLFENEQILITLIILYNNQTHNEAIKIKAKLSRSARTIPTFQQQYVGNCAG